VDDAVLDCCRILGLKRVPPPQKSLEKILAEDDPEAEEGDGDGNSNRNSKEGESSAAVYDPAGEKQSAVPGCAPPAKNARTNAVTNGRWRQHSRSEGAQRNATERRGRE
jgi:hypothetical protein